eukprot:12837964-Alexandrium_andersonii.AAC.1
MEALAWRGLRKSSRRGRGASTRSGRTAFAGTCYDCSLQGCSQSYLPYVGKGFRGTCGVCFQRGRSARCCPEGKGERKG